MSNVTQAAEAIIQLKTPQFQWLMSLLPEILSQGLVSIIYHSRRLNLLYIDADDIKMK